MSIGERLREVLHYDPETGVFTWRVTLSKRASAGNVAGTLSKKDGHRRIHIDKKGFLASRLAWLYMTGEWPKNQMDHVDRNPSNDCFANLREASNGQNGFNKVMYSNNRTGWKGVHWHAGSQKWRASISVDGERIHVGLFDSAIQAHLAYCFKSLSVHGNFARF